MQVSKKLVIKKEVVIPNAMELIYALDMVRADAYCKNAEYDKGLAIYKDIISKTNGEPEKQKVIDQYINHVIIYAKKLFLEKKYLECIDLYRDLLNYRFCPIGVYKQIGLCMKALGNADLAIKFLELFEDISPDKEDVYIYLADLVYTDIKDNVRAIKYYEKVLEKNQNNFSVYNMLGHLYSTQYQDKFKDKQIYYLTRAYQLAPTNRIVVKNLAYVYGKFHETEKADEFYAKLMFLNPTHSDLHAYGAYLVQHQRFEEGFKYLQHRFQKEDLGNVAMPKLFTQKKKRWNPKVDITNKHILVHFEQGFGDSIMFVRFLEELKTKCAKVTLVVQNSLVSLFEDSNLGVDIYIEERIPEIIYDYYIPMMDLPLLLGTTPETIPGAKGYLKVPRAKINAYKKKYINDNNKIKIGIAYEGTLASKETDRDIPLHYLYPLMKMPDVEVYSFQVDDLTRQMDRIPQDVNLIRLGKTFKSWEDTACAMNCMDLMVTTDNGVMNLAGALGIKTFGLFNTIVEWRWFQTTGKDIAWYKSIRPFKCPTSKQWDVPVKQVVEEIDKIRCQRLAKNILKK